MLKDAQGQTVTGATAEAVAIYDRAVRLFLIGLVLVCIGLVAAVAVDSILSARRS